MGGHDGICRDAREAGVGRVLGSYKAIHPICISYVTPFTIYEAHRKLLSKPTMPSKHYFLRVLSTPKIRRCQDTLTAQALANTNALIANACI